MKKSIIRSALVLIDKNAKACNYGPEYRAEFLDEYRKSDKTLSSVKNLLYDFGYSIEVIDLDAYFG